MSARWTPDEIDYLCDSWGLRSVRAISRKLGRSEAAVTEKASKLRLGPHLIAGGYISLGELIQRMYGYSDMGSGSYKMQQWRAAGLHVFRHKIRKCSFQAVRIDTFWVWAEQHQNLMDFAHMEENIFGKEPEWVKRKRERDRAKKATRKVRWTPDEDQLLRDLLKEYLYDIHTIGKYFNRTEAAIKRRIYDLGLRSWPLRNKPTPWTAQEIDRLVSMHTEGYARSVIAAELGRSEQSCSGMLERIARQEVKPNK